MTCTFTAGVAGAAQPESSPAQNSETSAPANDPPPSSESSAPSSEPVPVEPPASVQQAQVETSAEFDKPSYNLGELVKVTFRVKNVGDTKAVGLRVSQFHSDPGALQLDIPPGWGNLQGPPGVDLEPGATHETGLSGRMGNPDVDELVLAGFVYDHTGFSAGEFRFTAKVTTTFVRVGGIVFGDANGNGAPDAGEELPGVTLTWTIAVFQGKRYTATTDSAGRFVFPELPVARYYTGGEGPDGWLFPFVVREITESTDNLDVRAVPPLNGALDATVKFTKNSYAPGELAHLEVTLSNSGPIPLRGIIASCNRVGNANGLYTGPGWGDLFHERGGVTIGVGETKTFEVTENVPEAAIDYGYVFAACDFGYAEVDIDNHAFADDEAAVPGGLATFRGRILVDQTGGADGLAGVKLVLVRDGPCPVVGETTSGTDGRFQFEKVPPGRGYKLYFLPPTGWRMLTENPEQLQVVVSRDGEIGFAAERGDAELPTVPTNPGTCTAPTTTIPAGAAPQARSDSGLASTGANVIGLAALGLAALLLGAGTVGAARRRRTRPTG